MIKIENRILSPTAVNTYLSCPRKYYLRYFKRLSVKPSIHLIRGQIVHNTIHQFNKNPPQNLSQIPTEKTCQELLKVFNEKWEMAKETLDSLGIPKDQIAYFHHESELMLINFGQWLHKNGLSTADLAEAKMWSTNLRIMGVIDAIHILGDRVILVDYKTSKYAKITEDIERQAAIYALLYEDKYDRIPHAVWIHFLKVPEDPLSISVDKKILDYGRDLIESVREKTASNDEKDYPCTCGGHCKGEFMGDQNGTS